LRDHGDFIAVLRCKESATFGAVLE